MCRCACYVSWISVTLLLFLGMEPNEQPLTQSPLMTQMLRRYKTGDLVHVFQGTGDYVRGRNTIAFIGRVAGYNDADAKWEVHSLTLNLTLYNPNLTRHNVFVDLLDLFIINISLRGLITLSPNLYQLQATLTCTHPAPKPYWNSTPKLDRCEKWRWVGGGKQRKWKRSGCPRVIRMDWAHCKMSWGEIYFSSYIILTFDSYPLPLP